MKRPRNSQRSKVDRAQDRLIDSKHNERFKDLGELADYAEVIAVSDIFTGYLRQGGLAEQIDLRIGDGRGRKSYTVEPPSFRTPYWEAKFPTGTRTQANVCIILPWIIAEEYPRIAYDGPEVVAMRLGLVEAFMHRGAGQAFRKALAVESVKRTSAHRWPGNGIAAVRSVALRDYTRRKNVAATAKSQSSGRGSDGRPRDSQKRRLYKAERQIRAWSDLRLSKIEDVQAYVRRVESSRLWRRLAEEHGQSRWVRVKDGRGSSRSRAKAREWTIHIVRAHRSPLVVLHELAHLITPRSKAAHGPEFSANFLCLIDRFIGSTAAEEFRISCGDNGVQVCGDTLSRAHCKRESVET